MIRVCNDAPHRAGQLGGASKFELHPHLARVPAGRQGRALRRSKVRIQCASRTGVCQWRSFHIATTGPECGGGGRCVLFRGYRSCLPNAWGDCAAATGAHGGGLEAEGLHHGLKTGWHNLVTSLLQSCPLDRGARTRNPGA